MVGEHPLGKDGFRVTLHFDMDQYPDRRAVAAVDANELIGSAPGGLGRAHDLLEFLIQKLHAL
ncbi:MAG: hypothetical protein VBE63_12690 [Lamprobacter sp.]|uniref:hypothetical protein n=1 Tax=Lamprobacter sp. TaxID=3100796 RepID=UPI002B25D79D|nr:hypothetical protein [Lamprobacter sp.]MEA3640785.1 hypothetical protein [Lamprobacter sp.]